MSEHFPVRENSEGDVVPFDDAPADIEVRYQRPDETEYSIASASMAARAMIDAEPAVLNPEVAPDSGAAPESTAEPSKGSPEAVVKEADLAERIVTVRERFGFVPRSKQELNDTYDLIGKDLIAGAASHLNIVLNRQARYMEEPAKTVRSIVSRYADSAKNARAEYGLLTQLQELVEDEKGEITTAQLGRGWQYSGGLARSLLHVLWTRDVATYVQSEQDEPAEDPLKALAGDAYKLSNKQALARVQAYIDEPNHDSFQETLHDSISGERERYKFWVKALQESRKHAAGAPVAYEALRSLGELDKE